MTSIIRREWVRILALVAAGLAARLAIAWGFHWADNSDASVCLMMTRHMLEGRDWPVFFYGQAYMGNVEPFVCMLICKLVGWSTYRGVWGTVLIGLGVVPVAYGWARRVGGVRAGLFAAMMCLIGPLGFAHYSASPRGGYALQIAFTPAILFWVGCIAEREWDRRPKGWAHYLGVGLLAGLAWWTSQLILACLLTAGLIFLPALLRPGAWRRAMLVVAAFGVGSAPWWVWNATHQWGTFSFADSLGRVAWGESMANLLTQSLPDLLDARLWPRFLGVLAPLVYALALVWAAARTFRRSATEAPVASPSRFLLTPLWLYPLLHLGIAACSSFAAGHASRYTLPLFPILAVAAGAALAAPGRSRGPRWAAAAVVTLLVLAQLHVVLTHVPAIARSTRPAYEAVQREVVPALREAHVDALYCTYKDYWLNMAADEACIWSDPVGERYLPYMQQAEMTDHLGIWASADLADRFVPESGGSARLVRVAGWRFLCDLQPPSRDVAEIPFASWATARVAGQTNDVARTLTDRSLSTVCMPPVDTNVPYVVTVELRASQAICGVRWVNGHDGYPSWWRVEGADADGAWTVLTTNLTCVGYCWNGPRLYWGWNEFQARVAFPERRLRSVRLVFGPPMNRFKGSPRVAEISLFEPTAPRGDERDSLSNLVDEVRAQHVGRLYCGRWLANKVAAATEGRVWTPREMRIWGRRDIQDPPKSFEPMRDPLVLDTGTAFAVTAEDAPALKELMATCGVELESSTVGPWTFLRVAPNMSESARFLSGIDVIWWGTTALADPDRADLASMKLPDDFPEPAWDRARMASWLQAALVRFPEHPALLAGLAHLTRSMGDDARAASVEQRLKELTVADIGADVRYAGGLALTGVNCPTCRAAPGDIVRVRLFWKLPRNVEPRPVVFLHARTGGKLTFQNDVAIMEGLSPAYLATFGNWPISQEVALRVPPDAPPGRYTLQAGVLSRASKHRWRPRTDLPHRHGAVTLPLEIVVEPRAGG